MDGLFHGSKAYEQMDDLGREIFARFTEEWSSVLYLTKVGGPTAIFHQTEVLSTHES